MSIHPAARRLGVIALAAAVLVPAHLSAQASTFTPQYGPSDLGDRSQVDMKYDGHYNETGYGVYLGPYKGKLTSGYPTQVSLTVYCIDFLNTASTTPWTANVSSLDDNAEIEANTRLGREDISGETPPDDSALSRYQRAAWIASHFATQKNNASWKLLHAGIWRTVIAGPGDTGQPYYADGQTWYDAAIVAEQSGFGGMSFSDWVVLTDERATGVDDAYRQEYLAQVAPEPSTWVMLGTGLLALGFLGWRRREGHEPVA